MRDDRWDAAFTACARSSELQRALNEFWSHASRDSLLDALCVAQVDERGTARAVFSSGYSETEDRLSARLQPSWDSALRGETATNVRDDATDVTVPLHEGDSSRIIGAITVRFTDESRKSDADLLGRLARQVGAAVERDHQRKRGEARARLDASAEAAAIIAGELRDSLLGVSSASQLLRFRASEDPVLEKNVGRLLRDVERLNRLATSLLEFGRPLPLVRAGTDPDALWDEVVEQQRGLLESRSLIVQRTRTDPSVQVSADQEQLSRAFALLLQSAAESAPEATDLTLHCERSGGVWSSRLSSDARIEADAHRHALELLFASKIGSAGLGLALGRRIVEAHGGTLALDSSGGRTTLQVTLPAS